MSLSGSTAASSVMKSNWYWKFGFRRTSTHTKRIQHKYEHKYIHNTKSLNSLHFYRCSLILLVFRGQASQLPSQTRAARLARYEKNTKRIWNKYDNKMKPLSSFAFYWFPSMFIYFICFARPGQPTAWPIQGKQAGNIRTKTQNQPTPWGQQACGMYLVLSPCNTYLLRAVCVSPTEALVQWIGRTRFSLPSHICRPPCCASCWLSACDGWLNWVRLIRCTRASVGETETALKILQEILQGETNTMITTRLVIPLGSADFW